MTLLKELRRRNVFKVASVYLITAWIILQIISVVSPYLHLPRVFGTIITVILVIGFPIAAIFAWAFELTPDGLKRTHEVDADESIRYETGQKINNLLIGAIVVLVSFIAYDKLYKPNNHSQNSLSIAVLPFEDMSPDNSQEHFGDGIAEEILNSLAQIKHLSVIARTSSFSFKEQKISVKDIAQKLNVDFVLEGSVRKHGDKLRITAQLIDTKKDYHLWSNTYDKLLRDVFAIQDEVTQEITNALSIELLPEEQAKQYIPTTNPAAYELYLIAKNQLNKGHKEAATIAVESLQNALNLDPDFHLAKANLYMAYYSAWDLLGMTTEQLTEKHRELFTELIVTPDVFEDKSLVIADYLVMYMQNYQSSKKATEHAIKLNPSNTDALSTLVLYQNKDDAIKTVEKLLKLAPTNIEVKETASYWLSYAGEFKANEQLMAELGEIAPDSNEYLSAAFINFFMNKKSAKRALDFADNFQGKINRDNLFLIARLKLITRDIDGALAMLEESKDNYPYDERLAHNLTEMLKAQSLNIWTDSQRNRLEKLISNLDDELQLIVHAKANLQIGNYHEVIKNKRLREIAKSTLPTLRAGIAIREDFAINFALVDAFLGNTDLIELANKRWHHLESFCSNFLAFTGCPSLLYYSGKETDKQVLFERLKFILNGSFRGTWGAEQYLLTDPSYLFLHDVPEFKDFAKQYIESNFSEKSPLSVL